MFVSRTPAPKTAAQKKISSLALKMSKAQQLRMKSGPVTVLVSRNDKKAAA